MLRAGRLLGLSLLALGACSGGEYTVVVRFETPALASQVERLEVYLVDGCATLATTGALPLDPRQRLDLRRGGTTSSFTAITPGSYGLYARGFDGSTCQVIAAGCQPVSVEAGGEGELSVTVLSINGPSCPTGMPCSGGVCGVMDAGMPDGGADTSLDAPLDTGVPCSCVACASCDDAGACVADNALCGAGMYCDLITGCTDGAPCMTDAECTDDDNPCTTVACDPGLEICVATAVSDGTSCSDDIGRSGQCRAAACCSGCWDGGACSAGDLTSACGTAGDRCAVCDDSNVCTTDTCSAGACGGTPTAGPCPGGQCAEGACCTGCLEGGSCSPGDVITACGAGGASCAACDPAACPPERCAAGGTCMPLGASSVDIRRQQVLAIAPDGTLWGWGENAQGQLGLGDGVNRNVPTQIGSDSNWAQVSAGRQHGCAVKTNGQLWCWGSGGGVGRLGLGTVNAAPTPMRVGAASNWSLVSGASDHTCALTTTGELWCWGDDRSGRAGASTSMILTTPTRVGSDSDWTTVDARSDHTCGIRGAGLLFCWGDNSDDELGVPGPDRSDPTRVGSDTDWRQVVAGGSGAGGGGFTCALKTDSSRWCWGENGAERRYGAGTTTNAAMPVMIDVGPWRTIALGSTHGCGIRMDRSLWCWGADPEGATGQSMNPTPVPAQVGTATNFVSAAGGSNSTCAARASGEVLCFGANNSGQLGRGPGGASIAAVRACL